MTGVTVTEHAISRYCERIEPCSREIAKQRILASAPAIIAAAQFGATVVKLPGSTRLVLDGLRVVTVLAKWQGSLLRREQR
jgi:hypothetical protein